MTSFKNKNIAGFIQEQLKLIKPFQVIELPLNDNNIENLDIAVKETEIACKKLIKKNGALRDIIKKIKSNKLNKKQSNLMLNKISTNIKSIIEKQTNITNKNVKFLINNRINQILKSVIFSLIDI
jgi:hypothetical protein